MRGVLPISPAAHSARPERARVASPALTQLYQLQRSLYEKAYEEAHAIVAGTSRTILSYSAKFEKSLPQKFQRTTQADMLDAVKQRRFLLYGDFHTLRQSQRGLLRLMRSYTERQRTTKVVIALEMFKAIDQDSIDAYLAGNMPEVEFLDAVSYQSEWGFPWQNFRMILDFAKARGLPVIGINTENAGRDSLLQRDKYAARCLVDAAERYPDHKVMCLIGEYHLADGHLPKALSHEMRRRRVNGGILRVLNNIDDYYFLLKKTAAHNSTEYLRLRKDFYCIMNSPPWMKWQSFSMWEEMRHVSSQYDQDGETDPDLDLHTEDTYDIDYQFLHFAKNLAGFLGLKIDASDIESFHVLYSPDADFYEDLTEDLAVDPKEAHRMVQRASLDGVYFLGRSNTVLLTYISINNLAEAAGQYLHRVLTGFDDMVDDPPEDFYRRVVKSAIGMIASKILNPRRKCRELHHFRQFLRRHRGQRLTDQASRRRTTANGVLKFDRWIREQLEAKGADGEAVTVHKAFVLLDRSSHFELSRELGQMLGFALYKKVIANKEPAIRLRRLFKAKVGSSTAAWKEVAELYETMLR